MNTYTEEDAFPFSVSFTFSYFLGFSGGLGGAAPFIVGSP